MELHLVTVQPGIHPEIRCVHGSDCATLLHGAIAPERHAIEFDLPFTGVEGTAADCRIAEEFAIRENNGRIR
ncbi:hypothetical protein N4264_05075 [Tahibacter amnicola]|uniref:Uncharacterized protein n=1 Tax=Tahibacter amnicola TaxID=2976241 RepID=A0ABY6BGP0_9GAMM|nr:hypothetical protein [Tahibacter amnicola]UXI69029.1 hypothetical protein N4264_05075 [Tahibacter amnicola]